MNYKMMSRFEAWILAIEAVFMLPAFFISLFSGADKATLAFAMSIGILAVVAGLFALASIGAREGFYAREGLICVSAGWILMSLFGCLPFWLSGEIPRFIDALFEIVSGFTTTGASILSDVESLSNGILYWRSFSHWLGGMGVLVFLLAIVPSGGRKEGFTMHLLRAESPGVEVEKLVPKSNRTARILYGIYFFMTVLQLVLLLLGDMPFFDAVTITFGTAGTGGFAILNSSIASYSVYVQVVVTVFMVLFGVNFNLYFLLLCKKFRDVFRSEELRAYLSIFAFAVIIVTVNIFTSGVYSDFGQSLQQSAFQVASVMTTTGFATTDFNYFPELSKSILVLLMIIGACAGSTGGGIKVSRLIILLKSFKKEVRKLFHPRSVTVIKLEGKPIDVSLSHSTVTYFMMYMVIMIVSCIAISVDNFDFTTNVTAVIACFNNIGPGLNVVGPMGNFSGYSVFSKLVLSFDMLFGRLEILPVLILFTPRTWKRT